MSQEKFSREILKKFDDAISHYIKPSTSPIAVRMVKAGETLPDKTRRPKAQFGHSVAVCQTFSIARRYGWQVAVGEEDVNCPLALTAFGLKPITDTFQCGEMCGGMYTATNEAGAKTESELPKFNFNEYQYILTAPISRTDFRPHLYLIYGNSAQVMRLMIAHLWKEGGYVSSRFSGRLDCADICIETMQTGKPQVVLPCYGDRVFAQTQDHEMAFTVPRGLENQMIEGFEGTHEGGIRYPIPSYLRFEPKYPEHYYKLFDAWEK